MRISKRLGFATASNVAAAGLTWWAILKAAESPDAANAIAAIAGSCIAAMIAASWKYVAGETERPSGKKAGPSPDA